MFSNKKNKYICFFFSAHFLHHHFKILGRVKLEMQFFC